MITLERCEICGNKMSEAEKQKFGHECQECIDHLKAMFKRAFETGSINWRIGKPNLLIFHPGDEVLYKTEDDFTGVGIVGSGVLSKYNGEDVETDEIRCYAKINQPEG